MSENVKNILTLVLIVVLALLGIRIFFAITGLIFKLLWVILLAGVFIFVLGYLGAMRK